MERELLYIENLKKNWDAYDREINALNGFPNLNTYEKKSGTKVYEYYFYTVKNEDGEFRNKHINQKNFDAAILELKKNGLYHQNALRSYKNDALFAPNGNDGIMPKDMFLEMTKLAPEFCKEEKIINMTQWHKDYFLSAIK